MEERNRKALHAGAVGSWPSFCMMFDNWRKGLSVAAALSYHDAGAILRDVPGWLELSSLNTIVEWANSAAEEIAHAEGRDNPLPWEPSHDLTRAWVAGWGVSRILLDSKPCRNSDGNLLIIYLMEDKDRLADKQAAYRAQAKYGPPSGNFPESGDAVARRCTRAIKLLKEWGEL